MRRVVELESFSKDYRKLTKDMQKIKRIDEDLRETIKTQMEGRMQGENGQSNRNSRFHTDRLDFS